MPASLLGGEPRRAGALPAARLVKATLLSERGSSVCKLHTAPSRARICKLALLCGHGPVTAPTAATCPRLPGHEREQGGAEAGAHVAPQEEFAELGWEEGGLCPKARGLQNLSRSGSSRSVLLMNPWEMQGGT